MDLQDNVTETARVVKPLNLYGDIPELPVDVESGDYDDMPETNPKMWLWRYQFADVLTGAGKDLHDKVKRVDSKNSVTVKTEKTLTDTCDEFHELAGSSTGRDDEVRRMSADHDPVRARTAIATNKTRGRDCPRKKTAEGLEHPSRLPKSQRGPKLSPRQNQSKKTPTPISCSVQSGGNCRQNIPINRGRGRPRKQVWSTLSMATEANPKLEKTIGEKLIHHNIQSQKKVYHRGKRFSPRLEVQQTVASKTTAAVCSSGKRGYPDIQEDHSHKKHLKNGSSSRVLSTVEAVNIPRKRGLPRKCPAIIVHPAELCVKCYDKIATTFGQKLDSKVLQLETIEPKPALEIGIGKRARGRPKKVRGSNVPELKPKEVTVSLEGTPSSLQEG